MRWLRRLLGHRPPVADDGMTNLECLCDVLREFEGLRLKPYLCSGGKWTYGYGSTYTLGKRRVTATTAPISKATAERLLLRDAEKFYNRMCKALRADASDGAKVAFASLAYNMGAARILNSDALEAYNTGNLRQAEKEFKEWRLAKGKILPGLVRRRATEWNLVKQSEG